MSLEDFKNRWLELCEKFVGDNKFSERRPMPIFKAQGMVLPDEVKTAARREDIFEELRLEDPTVNGFNDFTITDERLEEATNFLKYGEKKLALEYQLERGQFFHVVNSLDKYKKNDIWFIGDVHGDILGLRTAIAFINSNSKHKPIYIFMGDLFDRNLMSLNVVLDVVKLIREQPGQVLWISGNHDDGLDFDSEKKQFSSRVIPNEFSEFLNLVDDEKINSFAKELISFIHKLPIGLLFENGLLVTHGGIPSRHDRNIKDVWENVKDDDISNFISSQKKDILCNRFDSDAMSGTKTGDEFSWIELLNLSKALKKKYGISAKTYLRGHDHCELCRHKWATISNHRKCKEYENSENVITDVLTMTSMVLVDDGEKRMPSFSKYEFSYPTVARLNNSTSIPQCYSISIKEDDIKSYENGVRKAFYSTNIELLENRKNRLLQEEESLKSQREHWESEAKKLLDQIIKPEKIKQEQNNNEIVKVKEKIKKIEEDIKQDTEEKNKRVSEIEKYQNEKVKIKDKGNAKIKEIRSGLSGINNDLEKIIQDINSYIIDKRDSQRNRRQIEQEKQIIYNRLRSIFGNKFEYGYWECNSSTIIKKIQEIKNRKNEEAQNAETKVNNECENTISELEDKIENIQQDINIHEKNIEKLESTKSEIENNELNSLNKEKGEIENKLEELKKEYNNYYINVESLGNEIGKKSKILKLIEEKLEEFNNILHL